jgi:dTDP-4-amino-4,6-dideoxy-D-galactose acyltransferase
LFTKLEWDTNFFGINIARLVCDGINETEFNNAIELLKRRRFQLIYCVCRDQESESFARVMGQLVDKKVVYHKVFNHEVLPAGNNIEEYLEEEPSQKLYDLAIQSGLYSRFKIDTKLSDGKFDELYKAWIRNSTLKKMAFKVLISKENDDLVGMITLGEKDGRADIGLLAVDCKYRGKGIGKSLIIAAENEFKKIFKEGQIVTQKDNLPACNLYEKNGYKIEKVEAIYHIWL